MADQITAPSAPPQPWFDPKTGNATEAFRRFILGERSRVRNVNTGIQQVQAATAAQTAALQAQITAQQNAAQAAAAGSTVFDTDPFSGVTVSGAGWVTLVTNQVTPTGAGNYTISGNIDGTVLQLNAGSSWTGAWRITEELQSGGTVHELATGSAVGAPPHTITEGGEGGGPIEIDFPGSMTLGSFPYTNTVYAANETAAVDIRLELQRTSGTNDITAPGLSGVLSTAWA